MAGYDALPDTLDLTDRAKLMQNYLIRNPDAEQNYRPYFSGSLGTEPASYSHSEWDFGDAAGRFVEGFILNRLMVGDREGEEVEEGVRGFLFSLFREDGLSYRGSIQNGDPSKQGDMFFWDQGRTLYGLVTWYVREREERARKAIRRMIQGLKRAAVYEREVAYFPYESMFAGRYVERRELSQTLWAASGQPIEPLVRYYEDTGEEEALAFAGQLTRGLLEAPVHFFEPSGAFTLHEEPYHYAFHVHSHTGALIGLLRYGMATGDHELIALGQRGYDWIRKHSSTRFGWTCEHYPYKTFHDDSQEVCCMADMLTLAILLAEAGYERYWNDVERIARNHLIESQITSMEMYEPFLVGLKHLVRKVERVEDGWHSYDDIYARVVGATSGEGWANEMYRPSNVGISGCCSPHMNKGFYLVWSHIITRAKGEIRVNLSLNFNSPWVEVHSYRPYQGKVAVRVKEDTALAVRIPDGVDAWDVKVCVGEQEVPFRWQGSYVRLEGMRQGQVATVHYPMRHEWIGEEVGTARFDLKWRGDTVVEMKPKGMVMALYQRTHMDREETPMRSKPLRCAPEDFHVW
ncbi:MAG: hypothetical protein V1800_08025 [Candidatus Latescibacterota bacterium]